MEAEGYAHDDAHVAGRGLATGRMPVISSVTPAHERHRDNA
jgi:hypothetical protein